MERFKRRIAAAAAPVLGMDAADVLTLLENPRDPRLGDVALPCFVVAKRAGRNPAELAREVAERVVVAPPLQEARAVGPYVNFTLDPGAFAAAIVAEVLERGAAYGASDEGAGKPVVIDFSSPNIAKPFGIHHLRSTVIGAAIGRILRARGHEVIGVNHLGDWGTQFGQLIVAFRRWGDAARLERERIPYLLELYVRFNKEKAADPALQDEARAAFRDLEHGEPECRALWQRFREVSLEEFRRVYDLLGVRFDQFTGESFYEDKMPAVLRELEERGLLTQSQDATIVDLTDEGLGVSIVKKKDDATLYVTRDLAAAIYRHETFRFDKALYVVGAAQSLHFKQMFRILEKLGRPFARDLVHVPFGLLRFKDRKMSTRTGDILLLEEVLDRAVEMARSIIAAKNPDLPDKEQVARAVGIGAVVFNDLKSRRIKDVTFDWDEVLSFEGDTGPYLQYTCARIASVFRTGGFDPERAPADVDYGRLTATSEKDLVRTLAQYPEAVRRAAAEYEPSVVADHLLATAAALNRFYIECRVLGDDRELMRARLALIGATRRVLRNGLGLLGLEAPEAM